MNSSEIHIREAKVEDINTVLEFVILKAEFDGCPGAVEATPELLKSALFGDAPSARILLAESAGVVVGFASYYQVFSSFLGRPGIWLDDLFVKDDFRGRGIGKMLMKRVIQVAKERGCTRIDWWVAPDNVRGAEFYAQFGAKPLEDARIWRMEKQGIEIIAGRA